jgi:hypothetical protein
VHTWVKSMCLVCWYPKTIPTGGARGRPLSLPHGSCSRLQGTLYGCDNDNGVPATASRDAFTGYGERDSRSLGQVITIEEAARTPGAAVLRVPQVGANGHTAITDGVGGTVEAHSPKDGVIQFTLAKRRWDKGILFPGIAYTQGSVVPVSPPKIIYRLATPMMTGDKVREIQQALKVAGFEPGPPGWELRTPHTCSGRGLSAIAWAVARRGSRSQNSRGTR